ncbi:hypothetical protein GEMRC1_002584 [Eukaryota sp. GEM-RC1]
MVSLTILQLSLLQNSLTSAHHRFLHYSSLSKTQIPCPKFAYFNYYLDHNFVTVFADRTPLRFPCRVSFSSHASYAAVGSMAGVVHLVDTSSSTPGHHETPPLVGLTSRCTALATSPSASSPVVSAGDGSGNVVSWHCDSSTSLTTHTLSSASVTSLHFLSPSAVSFTNSAGSLYLLDLESGDCLHDITVAETALQSSDIHPDNSILAIGDHGSNISLWDLRNSKRISILPKTHTDVISSLSWASDGVTLACGGGDNLITVWDARHLKSPTSILNHSRAVSKVKFLPSSRPLLASACFGGVFAVQDLLMKETLWSTFAHDGRIHDFDLRG